MSLPILYSFRRCPYAIRARLAILLSGKKVELREVALKSKPEAMIAVSPKGTVPVLVQSNGEVISESLDIMLWSFDDLLTTDDEFQRDLLPVDARRALRFKTRLDNNDLQLVDENDGSFKHFLDRYKYFDRYPQQSQQFYREKAMTFINALETRLVKQEFLNGEAPAFIDLAVFPFVRQFAHVDRDWFFSQDIPHCIQWLTRLLESHLFQNAMKQYTPWEENDSPVEFGGFS